MGIKNSLLFIITTYVFFLLYAHVPSTHTLEEKVTPTLDVKSIIVPKLYTTNKQKEVCNTVSD